MTRLGELQRLAPVQSEWARGDEVLVVVGWRPNRRRGWEVLVEGADRVPRFRRTEDFRPGGSLRRHTPDLIGESR